MSPLQLFPEDSCHYCSQASSFKGFCPVALNDESAAALASVDYRDDQFCNRRLYTAWDNLKDEKVFFRGIDTLEKAGIPGKHLMAYMLIGFDGSETWGRIMYRLDRMVERGILPYPMVYDPARKDLKRFQRWVIRGYYRFIPWKEYDRRNAKAAAEKATLF